MAKTQTPPQTWSFENRIGIVITTGDPTTAQKYREDPENFTEVHAAPEAPASEYDGANVAALKAQIVERNEGRAESDQIPTTGKKADLVAALEADDAAQTVDGGTGAPVGDTPTGAADSDPDAPAGPGVPAQGPPSD